MVKINPHTFLQYNDKETLKFISEGQTDELPVFFLNNFNPFPYYKAITNLTFDDLVIINALGFYEKEELEKYIFNRNNPSQVKVDTFTQFTNETCGLLIFREQMLNAIQHFTNWEFERADKMRKELGKAFIKCKEPFIECFKDKKSGENIFETLYKNRLHTIQKSFTLNQTRQFFFLAYCKRHDNNSFYYHYDMLRKHIDSYFSSAALLDDTMTIDISNDFYSFREEVKTKLGDNFALQADLFFQRAVNEAQNNLEHSAIADSEYALTLAHFAKDNFPIIDLFGFLCEVHIFTDKIKKAKHYYNLGIQLLDKNSPHYDSDKASFDRLKDLMNGEDWKEKRDDNE